MPMFIETFFMLCIIALHQVCARQPMNEESPTESATVDHKSTIFSLINDAGNCSAYEGLKKEANFRLLEEYCGRPLPGVPSANEFLSYEVVLCMVLYDAVQRVCKVGHQEVTKEIQNFSGGFACDTMIEGVPEASAENTKHWVELFKAKIGNIANCERECIQDTTISPVCEHIWKANTLTHQHVSSAVSADIPPNENPQVNSKGHGKTNKDKPLEVKASDVLSIAGPGLSTPNTGSQNTEQVDHKMTSTNESAVHKDGVPAEANGTSTQSGSANDVKNSAKEQAYTKGSNVQNDSKEQAQATVNTGHNDAKKQAHTAGNNTQNDINEQAHGTNSNVQNMKKQEHTISSSNQSAHNDPVSHSVYTDSTSESVKNDDSTGKSISSDSKSNTISQPENKSSAGYVLDQGTEKKNDDDEFIPTDENGNEDQVTDVAGNPNDDEDQEVGKNTNNQEEKSVQLSQPTDTHQDEAETGNIAQFNQLGDAADSHFYAYFMTMVVICIIGYLVFHNKQKILALALEGRSRRGTRRRPNTSAYRKLDSNLEEAVTSTGSTSVTHVIY